MAIHTDGTINRDPPVADLEGGDITNVDDIFSASGASIDLKPDTSVRVYPNNQTTRGFSFNDDGSDISIQGLGVSKILLEDTLDMNDQDIINIEALQFDSPSEFTISAGVITPTQSYIKIDTESNDPADDLDTITALSEGTILICKSVDNNRDPTLKDGTGNLVLAGGVDFTLATTTDRIVLISTGASWVELCRSTN